MRYVIRLAFKGTRYHGWQKQHNALSVQGVLDEKLSLLLGANTETLGCGRTDAGVHAKEFYVHFDAHNPIVSESQLIFKLNQILPDDIAVFNVHQVGPDFNARFDAVSRTYEYLISTQPDPFLRDRAWYQYGQLNIPAMNEACQLLIGKKDFESFSKVHTQVNHFVCEVTEASWRTENSQIIFTIAANRFLRNMVRAIVGTLINIGRGKINPEAIEAILAKKDRAEAGQSVPAHGLYLTHIQYPEHLSIHP
jgi:tRNA pseudouridine38-40 synthase